MSEKSEGSEAGATGADPVAISLALTGADRAEANAYLRDQRQHMHEQLKEIGLRLWELRLGVMLRIATLVVGLAAATGVGLMVWQAARSHGLIVEGFAVPPDMTARGLSGDVVASQMLDRLSSLQEATSSSRGPQTYQNNWGSNLKVEIPETGISIEEAQRFLKEWLGHDTRIRGEVYRTATGIAVTARAGNETGATFAGAEADFDALMQKAAEHVYEVTQPYRYANYLDRNYNASDIADRRARAAAIYEQLRQSPDVNERAWALNGLGTQLQTMGHNRLAEPYFRQAIQVSPDFTIAHVALAFQQMIQGDNQGALPELRTASRLLNASGVPDVHPRVLSTIRANIDGQLAKLGGDFDAAARYAKLRADLRVDFANQNYRAAQFDYVAALARQHDLRAARAHLRDLDLAGQTGRQIIYSYEALEDWRALARLWASVPAEMLERVRTNAPAGFGAGALAKAHLGDMAGAEALIAATPADCDDCLVARAKLAEMQGQHARADWWFVRAQTHGPSMPFSSYEWGQALLARGKPDAAIAQFKLANQKGPHFTDPLEGWGEALMAKNQSHLALVKFKEAEKYAPNWGRLHLKWGEALVYAGKKDEAKAQFARAAQLDLTPSEKAELAKVSHV